MAPMSWQTWWAALKENHEVLGIVYFGGGTKAFSFFERCVFLVMAIGAAWFGVFVKYFFLPTWIPMLFAQVEDELQLFPDDWIEDHIDSAACSALGGAVDIFLGKEVVRGVLKKDWESKGGVRSLGSHLATVYAFLLAFAALAHIIYFLIVSKPHLQQKLMVKFMAALVLKLCIIETCIVTGKAFAASLKDENKKA